MSFKQKRKRINEISPEAYRQKLGSLLPEVVRKKLAEGDIASGKATINIGNIDGELCSVLVKSDAGAVRSVTAFTYSSGTAAVTASSIAAGDTVTLMFI